MPCTTDLALLVEAGSQRFLANNLPQLRQYHHEILRCLYEQNWEGAAVLTHRLSGTAHLYGSADLIQGIDIILSRSSALIDNAFIASLSASFQQIEASITAFLGWPLERL